MIKGHSAIRNSPKCVYSKQQIFKIYEARLTELKEKKCTNTQL